jgi:polo-like kinase 1
MYSLLIGHPPFETAKVESTYKRIKVNDYSFPPGISISTESQDLIRTILNPDPGSVF